MGVAHHHPQPAMAALRSLARTAASELAEQGVRVNAISPGPTDSGILEKLYAPEAAAAVRSALETRISKRRLGSTEEIARVVLFSPATTHRS